MKWKQYREILFILALWIHWETVRKLENLEMRVPIQTQEPSNFNTFNSYNSFTNLTTWIKMYNFPADYPHLCIQMCV